MIISLPGNLLLEVFKVTNLLPKIEKLKTVIDSYQYYRKQLNYSSLEIRKLKGRLFSSFFHNQDLKLYS